MYELSFEICIKPTYFVTAFDRLRYVAWSDAAAIILLLLTAICIVLVVGVFAVLLYFRSSPVVKMSPPFGLCSCFQV
jgi:hypothetical protein